MARPSSIDQLPEEVREAISEARGKGCTLDQIIAKLRGMLPEGEAPSRSALGRHIQGLDKLAERVNRSRAVASAIVDKFGNGTESRMGRAGAELLQSVILDMFMSSETGEDGQPLLPPPDVVKALATALRDLSIANKNDADMIMKIREETAKEMKAAAASEAETVGREKGLSTETVNAIKSRILGVKLPAK